MIRSFRDREAAKLFTHQFSKRYQPIARVAERKLAMIDSVQTLQDLTIFPGNHLEALKGDRQGQHSIRINDQFRICFVWTGSDAIEVEIVDYH